MKDKDATNVWLWNHAWSLNGLLSSAKDTLGLPDSKPITPRVEMSPRYIIGGRMFNPFHVPSPMGQIDDTFYSLNGLVASVIAFARSVLSRASSLTQTAILRSKS